MRVLLDTSFFIARETGRPIKELPIEVSETEISVVTIAELTLGVLVANDNDRSRRVATLSAVESTWEPLPISVEVARKFAEIVTNLRASGRKVPILDALLAATAAVENISVVTQDKDYKSINEIDVIYV